MFITFHAPLLHVMNRKYFILIPSPHSSGPVKGAYALANALATTREVTLVTLKAGPGANTPLDERIRRVSLAEVSGGWRTRIQAYRQLLRKSGERKNLISISMCFSADMVNRFCGDAALTCASVRGNLLQNYRMDYGISGILLAMAHLVTLSGFDRVVAMTDAMAKQVRFYTRKQPAVIGNFVDEAALEPYRNAAMPFGPLRFVFLASLSVRKQPLLLIRAMHELRQQGREVTLDIIGSGPLLAVVRNEVRLLGLNEIVRVHGQLASPYALLASADAMVIPSLSEGVSRAALEALHLGVPCVLRDVDGNAGLVSNGENGGLFRQDSELANAMLRSAEISRCRSVRSSLLPPGFRQATATQQYMELVEAGK